MNIFGKTMIFKNDYGYSTTISSKNQNGEYERMYIQVSLPRGVELENKSFIEITKGFMTFYKDKNGIAKPKFVIMEFNEDYSMEPLQEDDLPF